MKPDSTPLLIPPFTDTYNTPIPELWLSALLKLSVLDDAQLYSGIPLVYEKIDPMVADVKIGGRKVSTQQSRSRESDSRDKWQNALNSTMTSAGINITDLAATADAIEDELWTRTEPKMRRRVRAAVPLSPIAGLMQNQPGVLGTNQQNDYGQSIEKLYEVGRILCGDEPNRASERLLTAMVRRRGRDKRVAAVDDALLSSLCHALVIDPTAVSYSVADGRLSLDGKRKAALNELLAKTEYEILSQLTGLGGKNCFTWFYQSWNKLTSDEWSDRLPHRRWVDWLVTTIRLGVGTAYIFRSHWTVEATRLALDETLSEGGVRVQIFSACLNQPIIAWQDRSQDVFGQRNVHPQLRKLVRTAKSIEKLLKEDFDITHGADNSIEGLKSIVRADKSLNAKLHKALYSPELNLTHKAVQPVYNTIRDALVDRTSIDDGNPGDTADYYALMRSDTRGSKSSTYFDPSSEVVALLASLACDAPDGSTTLGDVKQEFQKLGFRPSQNELRYLLEQAGLCRAEADASLQVSVTSALKLDQLL